mmetsp:Transcript_41270/g.130421  ORF Transcript_41270/g.130421 Transcript_41270/m.130421 type:complete len:329 (+) Transcript_41270:243-1229(+)
MASPGERMLAPSHPEADAAKGDSCQAGLEGEPGASYSKSGHLLQVGLLQGPIKAAGGDFGTQLELLPSARRLMGRDLCQLRAALVGDRGRRGGEQLRLAAGQRDAAAPAAAGRVCGPHCGGPARRHVRPALGVGQAVERRRVGGAAAAGLARPQHRRPLHHVWVRQGLLHRPLALCHPQALGHRSRQGRVHLAAQRPAQPAEPAVALPKPRGDPRLAARTRRELRAALGQPAGRRLVLRAKGPVRRLLQAAPAHAPDSIAGSRWAEVDEGWPRAVGVSSCASSRPTATVWSATFAWARRASAASRPSRRVANSSASKSRRTGSVRRPS